MQTKITFLSSRSKKYNLLQPWLQLRRVWGFHRGNQKPQINEGQTTECPKDLEQKDKQRSTKHCIENQRSNQLNLILADI